jgi:poly(A) polymerase
MTAEFFRDQRQQAWLVGGSLRNILLGELCNDWDIVTAGDAPALARGLADTLGGFYAHLHEKASRVIVPLKITKNKDEGDASVPTPHNPSPAPTGTKPLPRQHHQIPTPEVEGDEGGQEVIFDVSPLKGKPVEFDLRQRDFTVNAIAVPLDEVVRYIELGEVGALEKGGDGWGALLHCFDPLNGVADIVARRLRAVDGEVFRHDPLRVLRAVRLMARYHLTMDGWTEGLVMRDSALLPQVAPERIHDELYAILAGDGAMERLQFMDAHGLLTVLIPEFIPAREMEQPSPHYWDVLQHSLQTVGMWEKLAGLLQKPAEEIRQSPLERVIQSQQVKQMKQVKQVKQVKQSPDEMREGALEHVEACNLVEIQTLLREAERQGIFSFGALNAPAMKLAVLLHDIGKPATRTIGEDEAVHFYGHPQAGVPLALQVMKRLRASTHDCRLVQLVTAHHMRPGQLGMNGAVTPRAVRRYFVDLGPAGMLVVLFSLADHLATHGPLLGSNEKVEGSKGGSWEQHVGVVCGLLREYIRNRERILPPRLMSGEELMKRLKLSPGPIVGELLELIAEAQAEGRIHSKEEALWLAEEWVLRTK